MCVCERACVRTCVRVCVRVYYGSVSTVQYDPVLILTKRISFRVPGIKCPGIQPVETP